MAPMVQIEIINGDDVPPLPFVIVDRRGCHVDCKGLGELWDPTVAKVEWGLRGHAAAATTDDAPNSSLSPLSFLLGMMRDADAAPELRVRVAQVAAPFVHGTEQERRRWRDRSAQSRPASVLVEQNDCEQPLGCGHAIGSVRPDDRAS